MISQRGVTSLLGALLGLLGALCVFSPAAWAQTYGAAINPVTNKIYVANNSSNDITVIDGATNSTTLVRDANAKQPRSVAINPVTNKVYVTNSASNNVTVVDGATN